MPLLDSPLLPPECKASILSFLCLEEVLQFASTSSVSLRDSLLDLHRRRVNMKKDLAYCSSWKTTRQAEVLGLWEVMTAKYPTTDWVRIPSVYDRVCELYKHIPLSHPMVDTIYKLKMDLAQDISIDGLLAHSPFVGFAQLFDLYRKLLCVQKMHAAILYYVVHANPMEKDSTVNLDQYMGDVLCVAYLINQSSLRLVEGGPSNRTFLRDMRQLTATKSCYLSWVYLHSSILRVKDFTSAQRHRLQVPEFNGLSEMVPNDHYINDFFLSSEMTLVFREFGPLGPAFRGRDVVRLREIPARGLFAYMISSDHAVTGETAMNALEWLCVVHEESRKAHPMTVRPPQVRLALPQS